MNPTKLIAILLVIGSCQSTKEDRANKNDTTIARPLGYTSADSLYATNDTVIIASKYFDTLIYTRQRFNLIIDSFPTLYEDIPVNPDISYARSGYFKEFKDSAGSIDKISFGSENGQDEYYILYSHFLKKKNIGKQLENRRDTLITILQIINDIYGSLNHGGTYFAHQFNRINGYAEYYIYEYGKMSGYYDRFKDISNQKKLYIRTLRQIVEDVSFNDESLHNKIKREYLMSEFSENIVRLDSLISNYFYLKKAQEFQFSYY
jgi:hypothetical protein